MHDILSKLTEYFLDAGISVGYSHLWATLTALSVAAVFCVMVYLVLSRFVSRHITRLVEYTEVKWDDVLFNPVVLNSVWKLVLTILLSITIPDLFVYYPGWAAGIKAICKIGVVVSAMMVIVHLLAAVFELFSSIDRYSIKSFKGLCQLLQLMVILASIIIIISILIGRDPVVIVSGLGAMAAVLMLVFQDTILGFIAGLQLTVNDMLHPGDWISAPKANINGIVLEVTLTTVKVQNFDMTIITIPPYTLVKDSFQNWRGMKDSGGRRVMKSFNIDVTSIRFVTDDEIERFRREPWWNKEFDSRTETVNLTFFRYYMEWYIRQIPTMVPDMLWMVRELQPTPQGLPLEIYFFTSMQDWHAYEHVQSELLDHMLGVVSRFGLRIFQQPTGFEIASLRPNANIHAQQITEN